jgi:DNA-3-methyladenine glycosylase II
VTPAPDLAAPVAAVAAADTAMAEFIERAGPVDMRPGVGDHLGALVRSILYQQLAGAAAAAIHGRVVDVLRGSVTAEAILAANPEDLRKAGLSQNKLLSIRDLATKVTDGTVPLAGIEALDDDEIVSRLSSVRGIGRWTAEMFLLFELRRLDVWPVDDLGVRNGWRLIHGLAEPPPPRSLQLEGDRFRPYRSIAAWYCWRAVHMARGAA